MSVVTKKNILNLLAIMTKLSRLSQPMWMHCLTKLALVSLGKYEEVIEWLDKVIVIDPNYADALNNRGFALYKLSKYEEVIEWYIKYWGSIQTMFLL